MSFLVPKLDVGFVNTQRGRHRRGIRRQSWKGEDMCVKPSPHRREMTEDRWIKRQSEVSCFTGT